MYLHQYLKEWRKNPQWSFSCCLALVLPLNDLHGEIRGMVGKNMLKAQLQTGMMGKPSISGCAKESGAMSFNLSREDFDRDDANTTEFHELHLKKSKHRQYHPKIKYDLGTQTEVTMPSYVATYWSLERADIPVRTLNI